MKRNKKDILLIARPDHSLLIYDALRNQSELDFRFITFKVLPLWMRKFTSCFSIQYVTRNVSICWIATLINVFKFTFRLKFAQSWKETGMLSRIFRTKIKKEDYRIIHYWSTYSNVAVEAYAQDNPQVMAIKDIHMPSLVTVVNSMDNICEKYGFQYIVDNYRSRIKNEFEELKNATILVVPSEYVLNSFKELFPEKKYLLVSYGISIPKDYVRKKHINTGHHFKFVYAGRISLEKGADILFDYFSKHPEYELHVYGNFVESQKCIFEGIITDNIILHGNIPKNTLQSQLRHYDIGIHLSRFDAYSLAVGEIIGCGLPVIVSDTTGNESDVRKYHLGLVTDNTEMDVARKISQLTEPTYYNKLLDNVHDYISSPQKSYGEKMLDLYKSLLKNGENIS